jgi:hypothetical protein
LHFALSSRRTVAWGWRSSGNGSSLLTTGGYEEELFMPHLKKLAFALVLPFTFGTALAAADPDAAAAPPASGQDAATPATLDTNNDGKADAWDRDSNGTADAWDTNGDGKPDKFDDDGDGKPDKAPR